MSWFENWVAGYDVDKEQMRSDNLDVELQAYNREAYADRPDLYGQVLRDETSSAAGTADIAGQIDTAFKKSISDNLGGIRNGIGFSFNALLKLIPWQVWVLLGVWLFVSLGGMNLLRRLIGGK